jgi:hypothetical protein
MVASTLTGERGRRTVPRGSRRRVVLGGGRVGGAARTGLGAGPASRSAATIAAGAAIFWDLRATRPAAWRRKAFHRWVEAIRGHLEPVVSLDVLAESFAHEATPQVGNGDDPVVTMGERLLTSPLLAAYVIRWLELADDDLLDPWRTLVA